MLPRDITDNRWFTIIFSRMPSANELIRLVLTDVKPLANYSAYFYCVNALGNFSDALDPSVTWT